MEAYSFLTFRPTLYWDRGTKSSRCSYATNIGWCPSHWIKQHTSNVIRNFCYGLSWPNKTSSWLFKWYFKVTIPKDTSQSSLNFPVERLVNTCWETTRHLINTVRLWITVLRSVRKAYYKIKYYIIEETIQSSNHCDFVGRENTPTC